MVAAVEQFLDGRALDGADVVRAAVVQQLAALLDGGTAAPPYALGRLAAELRQLLDEFEAAAEPAVPSLNVARALHEVR